MTNSNDNIAWLSKTYGKDNLVSAVLHLDEATPHIHATVVPIVTGERRKAKEKNDEPGKKKYRKKNPNSVRLCVDDVMTRINLKHFQDTYAEAMRKYGLQRGIDGSQARHITTQEFYRNAIAQKANLQEHISLLLQVEEAKRQTVDELKQKEKKALTDYQQADTLKQKKEEQLSKTESELKQVKGQLKTEKFKSTAAEAGSAIMDGISSALGTSKVKRQQQEIESLKEENQNQAQQIVSLSQTINRERKESEKVNGELKAKLEKIYNWLPDTKPLIRMGDYCKNIGFSEVQVKDLINMKPINFSGELYSKEHSQRFEAQNSDVRLQRDNKRPSIFHLLIDKISINDWFKQKHKEFLEKIGIKISERPSYSRNPKMR